MTARMSARMSGTAVSAGFQGGGQTLLNSLSEPSYRLTFTDPEPFFFWGGGVGGADYRL